MSVGLLLVTHERLGDELLEIACTTLGTCPLAAKALAVMPDADPDTLMAQAEALRDELDSGAGVLVLTDAYGSTPSNIACRMNDGVRALVVAGVNLPMLLRVMNYPDLGLAELQDKAVSGGQDGVLRVTHCGD